MFFDTAGTPDQHMQRPPAGSACAAWAWRSAGLGHQSHQPTSMGELLSHPGFAVEEHEDVASLVDALIHHPVGQLGAIGLHDDPSLILVRQDTFDSFTIIDCRSGQVRIGLSHADLFAAFPEDVCARHLIVRAAENPIQA